MKLNPFIYLARVMLVCAIVCTGCSNITRAPTPTLPVEDSDLPTPASTLTELLKNISSDDMGVRLVSIYALEKYGNDAAPAIPTLIENLYVDDFDVRTAAAYALGKLGPTARLAIPDLTNVLDNNKEYYHARVTTAEALGRIGDPAAIPALAKALFRENTQPYELAISCAESIAQITNERFTDIGSLVYTLDEKGVPLIVKDARNWWVEKGQYQDW